MCVFPLCIQYLEKHSVVFHLLFKTFCFFAHLPKKRERASRLNVTTCLPTCVLAENERGSEGVWKDGEEMLKSI